MDKDRVIYMLGLAKRKRETVITNSELAELEELRREYLADFRAGFGHQLDHVYIEQEDGSHKKLEKKSSDD